MWSVTEADEMLGGGQSVQVGQFRPDLLAKGD